MISKIVNMFTCLYCKNLRLFHVLAEGAVRICVFMSDIGRKSRAVRMYQTMKERRRRSCEL